MKFDTVRLILGDQLDHNHTWFATSNDSVLYVIAELHQEASYAKHHVQKVCAFFASMESFAKELRHDGHQVIYLTLDETERYESVCELCADMVNKARATKFEYQRPDEYRLAKAFCEFELDNCDVVQVESEHFLLPFSEISQQFAPNKHIMMEHFYRRMRKRFDILMEDGKPLGGKWNFDANNRNKLKPKDIDVLPTPLLFSTDIRPHIERLKRHSINTIGKTDSHLLWPTNRNQSLSLLAHFCQVCLPLFGRFQDAMTSEHPSRWSLYHSRLSFSLNSKMLRPLEVIDAALSAYAANKQIDISQVEGFIRQVLGWREYIRAVYWANMPHYATKNHLSAQRKLPDYFWSGETKMRCLSQAISQSLEFGYAHHIQRLMVTGNFCLITEIEPSLVDEWYLGIYVDAIEWVEMPNTRGMALFSDGGVVATKPYAASGSYINKMSDYCKGCHYKVKEKIGQGACPLNSLYWRFIIKHRERLSQNPRIGMIYRSWDKMNTDLQDETLTKAEHYLEQIESL